RAVRRAHRGQGVLRQLHAAGRRHLADRDDGRQRPRVPDAGVRAQLAVQERDGRVEVESAPVRHSATSGDAAGVRAMTRTVLAVVVLGVATVGSLRAQWLKLPTPDIPRTASGAPDISAPAPRLPDGKPDLSGQWITAAANSLPCGQGVVA